MLTYIWHTSNVLAALSIVTLLGLIVRRLIIQTIEARLAQWRTTIRSRLVNYIATGDAWTEPMGSATDERILLGVATDLMQNVSGAMHDRILALLNKIVNIGRMLKVLRGGTPGDRAKVAARLFWSQNPAVHAELRNALADKNPEVILAAANSLLAANQRIDLGALMPILKARDMLDHRGVRDLLRSLAPGNGAAISEMLASSDPEIVTLALDAFGSTLPAAMEGEVKDLAKRHPEKDVRAAAIRALGNAGVPGVEGVIFAGLQDGAWEVQAQAAVAAGRLRLVSLAPRLAKGLESQAWWVQWRSAQALARLGTEGQTLLRQVPFDSPAAALADIAMAEVHSP